MAFDPFPGHVMLFPRGVEPPPEVFVFDWLSCRRLPAVLFPAMNPTCYTALDVSTVGHDREARRTLERLECIDSCEKFHPVVGRVRLTAAEFALLQDVVALTRNQKRPPSSGAGVSGTCGATGLPLRIPLLPMRNFNPALNCQL